MKQLLLIFISLLILSSCRKDKKIENTDDVLYGYETLILIDYKRDFDRTDIQVFYYYQKGIDIYNPLFDMPTYDFLNLPENSFMLVNGNEMNHYPNYAYYLTLDGKPDCYFEFQDYDGLMYHNIIYPTDTVYFVNLPDTVPYGEDLIVQVHATDADSAAYNRINLNEIETDYYLTHDAGPGDSDSLVKIHSYYFDKQKHYQLFFKRSRDLTHANFPIGGGRIEFSYSFIDTVYVE